MDQRHRRSPGEVGRRPGGEPRQGVPDGRPVDQVARLNDLDVPGHRVRRVGVEGLADHHDGRIGEIEGVDQAGAGAAGQLGAGARDGRDVLGGLGVVLLRDLTERVLDATQTGLQRVDADPLHVGVCVRVGQRTICRRELAHGRGDRGLQGVPLRGRHGLGGLRDRHPVAELGEMCGCRHECGLFVPVARPGSDVGPDGCHEHDGAEDDDGRAEPSTAARWRGVSHWRPPPPHSSTRRSSAPRWRSIACRRRARSRLAPHRSGRSAGR